MVICAKHTNFILSWEYCSKTFIISRFWLSVSNPNDFNTHTCSKWSWWDGDSRKTQKFYSERKWFLERINFGRFGYNNCSASNKNDFNTHTSSNEHDAWEYAQNTKKIFRAEIIHRNHHYWSFLHIKIVIWQIQMILTLTPLQNQYVGMGICAKHTY